MENLLTNAFNWIAGTARPIELTTNDGRQWMDMLYSPVKPPRPSPLELTGLTSLIEFIDAIEEKRSNLIVVVESMTKVSLFGHLDDIQRDREFYASTSAGITSIFPAGQWMGQEAAVRMIQQYFEDVGDRAILLEFVGNLTAGQSRTLVDDGITQQATTKKGITQREMTDVPNPVLLTPYETFAEVENPNRRYVVRLQQEEGKDPLVSLSLIPDPMIEEAGAIRIRGVLASAIQSDDVSIL